MAVAWARWRPRLLYGAFFLLAFLFALRQTFPAEAVKARLIVEAAQRGWKVDAGDVGPTGLVGVRLRDLTVRHGDGVPTAVDALDVSLSPWALLRGRRAVSFVARLWDGRVRGTWEASSAGESLEASAEGLDLGRALPLRAASGLDLAGVASGAAHLSLPGDELARADGGIELSVREAGITGGKVPVPGMGSSLTLPRVGLGQVTAAVTLGGGKATVAALTARGGDLDLTTEGLSVALQPRLDGAALYGKVRLKFSDAFGTRAENRGFVAILDAATSGFKGRDGSIELQLFGSLGHPQARPVPGGR